MDGRDDDDDALLRGLKSLPPTVVRIIMAYSPALYIARGMLDSPDKDAVERRVRAVGARILRTLSEDLTFTQRDVTVELISLNAFCAKEPICSYVNFCYSSVEFMPREDMDGHVVRARFVVEDALDVSSMCTLVQHPTLKPWLRKSSCDYYTNATDGEVRVDMKTRLSLPCGEVPAFFRLALPLLLTNGLQGYREGDVKDGEPVLVLYTRDTTTLTVTMYALDVPTAEFDVTQTQLYTE